MKRVVQLLAAVAAYGFVISAHAALDLGTYNFNGGTGNEGAFTSGSYGYLVTMGTAPSGSGSGVATSYQTSGGVSGSGYLRTGNYNISPTPTYWSFQITPNTSITLGSLSASLWRNSIGNYNLQTLSFGVFQASATGVASPISFGSFTVTSLSTTPTAMTASFNPVPLTANTPYEIRFWISGSGAGSPAGDINFDDLRVDVTGASVPEPVNIALIVFALGGTGVYAGRRWLRRK
jgi:hypothetical protein